MSVIAVSNQKGGVGKTVTSVNLGIGLARSGRRVLLVDMDAQGSLTLSLGYEPDKLNLTISDIMDSIIADREINMNMGILQHSECVDLLPANIELAEMEASLVNVMSRETILRRYLSMVRYTYDYIILDCTPSLGMLTINALAAADSVMIPVQAQYLSVKGLEQLIRTISKVRRQINPRLDIAGILVTMNDGRTNYSKEIIELLHSNYDGKINIFKSIIPMSVRAAEISAEGKSIYLHDPYGKVAVAYEVLTKELIQGAKT